MATFSVRFLGCKVSQADAMLIRDALRDAGHVETTADRADVQVINSCALTVEAERKSRKQVNRARRAASHTFVTGCAANLNAEQFAASNVSVIGRSADRAAQEIVERLGAQPQDTACGRDEHVPGRTRAFLKVQNGCDLACSFCIIPQTRGPAESRPLDVILRDARRRLAEGHPELVLTGINIGTWREPDGGDLSDLIRRIATLDGIERVRISSIEPGDVTERLVATVGDLPVVACHMHIPLQSGDDGVLDSMGRTYTVDQYRRAAATAREHIPGLNITTDVIVGYPTEDEAAFERTYRFCEEMEFGKIHVFPFSARPGTRAAELDESVDPAVRAERSRRLRDLSEQMGFRRRLARVGTTDTVIVERRLDDGTVIGYGGDYSRFVCESPGGAPGDVIHVRTSATAGEHLRGEPICE